MWYKVSIAKTAEPRYHRSPWRVRWRGGGTKHYCRHFPTKEDALAFARRIENDLNRSDYQEIEGVPLSVLKERFLAAKRADGNSAASLYLYEYVLDKLEELAPGLDTSRLRLDHVDQFKRLWPVSAPATVNKYLRHLRAVLAWVVERHLLPKPIPVKLLPEARKSAVIWSPEQFARVYAACEDPQWRILALLCLNGVGRKYSVSALKVSDIDFAAGTVTVYDQKQRESRLTPLHATILAELTKYTRQLPQGQISLFTSKFHHKTWLRYIEKAKVPFMKFHDLRSCLSTWLQEKGVSTGVVSEIFGHSTEELTKKHYTNLRNLEVKRAAIDKLPLKLP